MLLDDTMEVELVVSGLRVGVVCAVLVGSNDRTRDRLWWLTIGRKVVGSLQHVLSHHP